MKMFDPIGAVNPGDIVWVPAVVVRIPDDPALLFVEVATAVPDTLRRAPVKRSNCLQEVRAPV